MLSRGTSLVVQWLRIHLLMHRTLVGFLVQEDPPCCGIAGPSHPQLFTLCSKTTEPTSHNY